MLTGIAARSRETGPPKTDSIALEFGHEGLLDAVGGTIYGKRTVFAEPRNQPLGYPHEIQRVKRSVTLKTQVQKPKGDVCRKRCVQGCKHQSTRTCRTVCGLRGYLIADLPDLDGVRCHPETGQERVLERHILRLNGSVYGECLHVGQGARLGRILHGDNIRMLRKSPRELLNCEIQRCRLAVLGGARDQENTRGRLQRCANRHRPFIAVAGVLKAVALNCVSAVGEPDQKCEPGRRRHVLQPCADDFARQDPVLRDGGTSHAGRRREGIARIAEIERRIGHCDRPVRIQQPVSSHGAVYTKADLRRILASRDKNIGGAVLRCSHNCEQECLACLRRVLFHILDICVSGSDLVQCRFAWVLQLDSGNGRSLPKCPKLGIVDCGGRCEDASVGQNGEKASKPGRRFQWTAGRTQDFLSRTGLPPGNPEVLGHYSSPTRSVLIPVGVSSCTASGRMRSTTRPGESSVPACAILLFPPGSISTACRRSPDPNTSTSR